MVPSCEVIIKADSWRCQFRRARCLEFWCSWPSFKQWIRPRLYLKAVVGDILHIGPHPQPTTQHCSSEKKYSTSIGWHTIQRIYRSAFLIIVFECVHLLPLKCRRKHKLKVGAQEAFELLSILEFFLTIPVRVLGRFPQTITSSSQV